MAFSNEFYDYLEEEVGKKISGYERKIKPIHIFKDGVLVMTANRIGEAEECVNSKWDSIYKCLRGERRSVKGYTFEYAERGGCN